MATKTHSEESRKSCGGRFPMEGQPAGPGEETHSASHIPIDSGVGGDMIRPLPRFIFYCQVGGCHDRPREHNVRALWAFRCSKR